MIVIVDNGKGSEEIAACLRMQNQIVKPNKIDSVKANAFILSDGDIKNKASNIKLITSNTKPVMAIGVSAAFMGAAFGAKISEAKPKKQNIIKIKKASPLTLDMRKMFSVYVNCVHTLEDLPENFSPVAASAEYEFEVFQDMQNPLFGVRFNPEMGADGRKIIDNFVKFIEVWEKYHKK